VHSICPLEPPLHDVEDEAADEDDDVLELAPLDEEPVPLEVWEELPAGAPLELVALPCEELELLDPPVELAPLDPPEDGPPPPTLAVDVTLAPLALAPPSPELGSPPTLLPVEFVVESAPPP
jgi:hypothetical protein